MTQRIGVIISLLLFVLLFVLCSAAVAMAAQPAAAPAAAAASAAAPAPAAQSVAVVATESGHSFPHRIPIGSVFGNDSVVSRTAFRFEFESHNNRTGTLFKLDKYEKLVNIRDNRALFKALCSTISKGIFALFGTTARSSARTVDAFGRQFQMPYVTPSAPSPNEVGGGGGERGGGERGGGDRAGKQHAFTLFMRPLYHKAILHVILAYKWSKIYYMHNTADGLSRVQFIHSELLKNQTSIDIELLRIQDVDRCHVALRQLDSREQTGDKFIVLDLASAQDIQAVIRQIQNVGMNRANYHYLLGGLAMDELYVDDFRHGGANITGFRLVNPDYPRCKEIQKEWTKLNASIWKGAGRKIQLEAALSIDALSAIVKGLDDMMQKNPVILRDIFNRGKVSGIDCKSDKSDSRDPGRIWKLGETIMKSFQTVKFQGVTGDVAFDQNGHRANYTLDILEQRLDREVTNVGTWNSVTGIHFHNSAGINLTADLMEVNRTRIVTTIISEPYLMTKKSNSLDALQFAHEEFEGYCVDLARKIAQIVGFTYKIVLVKDGFYGEKMANGTWNGMVGELTRKDADIAIAPLTISSMRERVIDFSKPFMNLGISIMIKKPEKQKPGVFSFMDPLAYKIWMCIIFSYLAVSIVLFFVSRFSPNEWQIEDSVHGPTYVNDFTILNSLWFALGAFMRRGCEVCPRSLSGRIVGSAWWFFTLIIISSYTANLAAFLTIERMLTPIKNADDLAKQTEILYGTLDAGSTKNFFRTSKIPVYEKMWSFMNNDPGVFVQTTQEGINRVRNSKGKYAFLVESTMNDYYNQRKPCNTMKVGDNLDSKGYGIATYIGSDLREKINVAVLQLLEMEQLQKLQKKWWYDKGECVVESDSKGSGSSQSSLSLSNVAGIFYILIGGLGLSMIIASLEFLYKSRVEARRQKKRYLEKCRFNSSEYYSDRENGGYAYSAPSGVVTMNSCFDVGDGHTQV